MGKQLGTELYDNNVINKNAIAYLTGELFDDGMEFRVNVDGIDSRIDLVKKVIKQNDNIIHLGACDHVQLIEKKRREHIWMHDILTECADKVLGIDIDRKAVKFCQRLGIDNIIRANILVDEKYIKERLIEYDIDKVNYIFAGEIIEHIENPVDFLKNIREIYCDVVEKIIITVPNIFSYVNVRNSLHGYEKINTDHKYWFTPYTISKVMIKAGIMPKSMFFTECSFDKYKKIVTRFFPNHMMYKNIVCIGKMSK